MPMMLDNPTRQTEEQVLRDAFAAARVPRLRTMRQFAEDEIVLPTGQFKTMRFRCHRQPYSALFFDAVDSGRFSRVFATGPTQSGKSLTCFVIPAMFHLFEMQEDVICGLPDMRLAQAKWRKDLLPVIARTRYRDLLPADGAGSKGGAVDSIEFRNGSWLHFMSAGGGDKSRASITSRVLVVTEVDGFDDRSETSREADKFSQLEGRLRATTSENRRLYGECTVTIKEGRTWREYTEGTESKIIVPCPGCNQWVSPERADLKGWDTAQNVIEARQNAHFACPSCGMVWTEEDRRQANSNAKLLHRGQSISETGDIVGDLPPTNTLGFRWSPVNNTFLTAADLGEDEWRARRASDEENEKRRMCQFVWAVPYDPPRVDMTPLSWESVKARKGTLRKGILPVDTEFTSLHIDVGKYWCYWLLLSWRKEKTYHVADYGLFECPSDNLPEEQAILSALRKFRDESILAGWMVAETADTRIPDLVTIDRRYQTHAKVVDVFVRDSNGLQQPKNATGILRFWPTIGLGFGKDKNRWYSRPKTEHKAIRHIGDEYYIEFSETAGIFVINVNADHWKGKAQSALACRLGLEGCISLYYSENPNEHHKFSRHVTAEKPVQEFSPTMGMVTKWVPVSHENHLGDCLYNALMALHFCGARLIEDDVRPAVRREQAPSTMDTPDGRPFLITERV